MRHLFCLCHVRSPLIRSLFLILIMSALSFSCADIVMAQTRQNPLMNDGNTYSTQEVTSKLNAFFVQYEKPELKLKEIIKNSTNQPTNQPTSNISPLTSSYRAKNCTLSLSAQIIDGKEQVYSITLREIPKTSEKLNDFIACSMGLMSVFTPEMNAKVRGEVLSRLMGLKRDKDGHVHFASQNTYIIVNTKYSFAYTDAAGLQLEITQMPPLEPYEGVPQGL